ncbi:MAG: hypothetical protein KAX15_05575 [Candidatus Omnitrophica bacterium]|nr:hypothetical protein [Candidatus Omnitrophota bacterium]
MNKTKIFIGIFVFILLTIIAYDKITSLRVSGPWQTIVLNEKRVLKINTKTGETYFLASFTNKTGETIISYKWVHIGQYEIGVKYVMDYYPETLKVNPKQQ